MNKSITRLSSSEVHAYRFIYDELTKKKEWKKEQIYTQQECQQIDGIKKSLGLLTPENIIKINEDIYYVVESKNARNKLDVALQEAKRYADTINGKSSLKALFATGIAGNDDEGFLGKTEYFDGKKWNVVTENEIEVTSLLSKTQVENLLQSKNPNIQDVEVSETEFLHSAEKINEILNDNSINKDYRARFISSILLALSDGSEINLNEQDTSVLISTINAKVDSILNKHNKRDFSRFIKIDEPSSPDNHVKVKAAIVKTIQELLGLNIRSAMRSGRDILGEFYEVFLKYGNGAKEIGIVLTPRHITKFAAEVLDIKHNDLVLDPACGTGGFIVAAFDKVKQSNPSNSQLENFKVNGLYGIEEQDPIIALAIVNMIFRGDGKNNMIEGNCFNKWLTLDTSKNSVAAKYISSDVDTRIQPITKVMMNPPFAQKSSKSKEYHFIDQALKQMQNEGTLFAILPTSVLIEKSAKQWRKDLLKKNTLLAVITFPEDLFYPTGTHTLGIFIKKGVPHPATQRVLWARCLTDGLLKKKGKRLKNERATNQLAEIEKTVKNFIKDPINTEVADIPEFQKAIAIDMNDETLELVPESYLNDIEPTYSEIIGELEKLVKETAGYLLTLGGKKIIINQKNEKIVPKNRVAYFDISGENGLCNIERKYAPYLNELDSDIQETPYVTTTESNNGVSLRCDTKPNFKRNTLTVSLDGKCGTTFYQFEDYIAGEKTAVITLKKSHDPYVLFYIAALIRLKSWRYHYGRKLSMGRLAYFKLPMPINEKGETDFTAIEQIVKNSYGWEMIDAYL